MSAEIASYPPKPGHLIWYDVHTRIYIANGDIDLWLRARADRIEAGS